MDLPEGPVTIMFTDIVGSTALRTSLGDREADQLFAEHDTLVRRLIEEHRGTDVKAALGDGFLAVFVSTRRALAAAVAIQRALDAFNRTRTGPSLAVRIGLNTGEVAWQDGQLSGEAVHAASRVCSAADSGQILASDVTRQLAGTVPDLSFSDTGEHALKGFPQPWRLWEVVWVRTSPAGDEEVFVARSKELGVLRTALTEALDGRGGLVLVGGEPGVGKTTLVRQLIRDAESRGALALFGRCYEFEGALPYSPFIEMLEHALSVMPPELVREDMGDDAAEVARMVPELRRRFPDIPAPLDLPPEQQRRYFFNAVESFLRRAAQRFPLLLVLDDVHWADVPTLLLIEHMAGVMPETRVLGVGTYRDVELDVSRPLAATLERLMRARAVDRLPLKRLDLGGVGSMLQALTGRQAPDQVVTTLFDETEGNPFFVIEVFRHLAEEGRLLDAQGDFRTDLAVSELDVPESVRLVVGRRLERLGPDAQRALAAGAVVGRGFPFALLEEIADVPTSRLVDVLEEAERARVIVPEDRSGAVHYTFGHELIRQTLLTGLSLLRRQRLHLAVADAMERLEPGARETRPSEIAHHLLQAGAAADPARTLSYLEHAADRAVESAAFEDALRVIGDALALVRPEDEKRRAKLRLRQGKAVRALGRYDECLSIWDEAAEVLARLGDRERAAVLCWEMGYLQIWLDRFDDAFLTYDRGRQLLGDEGGPARAALVGSQGVLVGLAGLHGMYDLSTTSLDEALAIAQELGDDREIARASWGRCVVEWAFLRLPEGEVAGRRAVEHARRAGDLWLLGDALAWLGFVLATKGDVEGCAAAAEESLEIAQSTGHIAAEICARRGLVVAAGAREPDLQQLERAMQLDVDLCASIGSPWRSQSLAWLSYLATMRGKLDAGLQLALDAESVEPVSAWSGAGWCARLNNRVAAGDVSAAEQILDDALGELTAPGAADTSGGFQRLAAAAEAAALLRLPDRCATLYPLLAAEHVRAPVGLYDWRPPERALAMVAAEIGRGEEAKVGFEAVLARVRAMPLRIEEPSAQHRYGEALLRHGDTSEAARARELLEAAREGYRRLGMPVRLAEVDELLRS
jgi:class 3 adenylate cyclase/tetratricopeptide (TPR) repeat protein